MKTPERGHISVARLMTQIESLETKLTEAHELIRAIQDGKVDGLITLGTEGEQLFTLKSADRPYRELIENMNEGAATLSSNGTIFYCNKRFSEMLEISIDEIIGSSLYPFIEAEETKRFNEVFISGKSGKSTGTFLLRTLQQQLIPVQISMSSSEINGEAGVCMVTTDLTQQMLFKENQKLAHELEYALRARDEFISIASHELKTPLTSLLLMAQHQKKMISRNDTNAYSKERIINFTEQTEKLTVRLNRLVEDMLDITRINSGKLRMEKERMDLTKLTKEILDRMEPQFIAAGYGRPSFHGDEVIGNWDSQRLEQVINNLLSNAIKYGNGRPIEVTISSAKGVARLAVKDHGKGILKKDQLLIFDRFARAVSANEISGLGLGLYISLKIIEAHNGKIWVYSEGGRGSCFFCELPLEPYEKKDTTH